MKKFHKTMIIISIVIIAITGTYVFYKQYQQRNIEKDIPALVSNGAIILDVRTAKEYSKGHIEGSVNIALSKLRDENLLLDKDKTYITCCSHGLRSIKAVEVLKARGYPNIYNGGPCSDLEKKIKNNVR